MEIESRHQCLIYAGPPSRQLPALAAMIQQKIDEGYRCIYLNSLPMVAGLRSRLAARGLDVEKEIANGCLVLSSESVLTIDGDFDVDLMLHNIEMAINQALSDGFKGLWASGDMTWEFGSEKNFPKLMEYEYRLEDLFRRRTELSGVCQYHRDTLPNGTPRQALLTHGSIFINETLSRLNPHYHPLEFPSDRMATNSKLDEMIESLCQAYL